MSGVTLTGGAGGSVNAGAVELTESGGRALKLQTDAPHLVSMGGGRLSTAVTLHPLPQGRVTLGSSPAADVNVQGTGVLPMHCHIENCGGVVTIYPQSENLSIDGARVTCPTRLSQGAMLTIGRSNYMRFNHPAEAKLIKAAIPNSRISMTPISFDMEPSYITPKYTKKPPVAPRKSPRESLSDEEPPSSIMTKVTKFEYLAAQNLKQSISPKVFSSNLVTVNMPAKEVLGKTPPDLETFAKSLPQSALNYSELNHNEKQKIKTPDRQIFGRKSPNYVNVTLNEAKSINNKVVIYENGCVPKRNIANLSSNEQLSNDLNIINNRNGAQTLNKTLNVGRTATSSPSFNNSFHGSNSSNNFASQNCADFYGDDSIISNISHMEETTHHRKTEAELQRNQAQVNRLIEQQTEKAEQLRLEEILNMCAEYEKQVQCEKTNKPMTPNRIKTNGSLPRDKRQCISPNLLKSQSPTLASSSPHLSNDIFKFDADHTQKQNNSYENVSISTMNITYENITPKCSTAETNERISPCSSPYENLNLPQNNFQQSPRTRIKTFVANKDSREMKSTIDLIESKFAAVQLEHNNLCLSLESPNKDDDRRKPTPIKFIMPLDVNGSVSNEGYAGDASDLCNESNLSMVGVLPTGKAKQEETMKRVEELRSERKERLAAIARIKRQMAEIEIQGEELHRDLQMEKALILGEYKSKQVELEKLQTKKEKLQKRAQKIDDKMKDCQGKQEEDQRLCKEKLQAAQENMHKTEKNLSELNKSTPEYEEVFEEYLAAQEVLENERKAFEDLEFHHLEEEADWLATREELQREIMDLSAKIEELNTQIIELENQQGITFETNAYEYKKIEQEKIELSRKIEMIRGKLKILDDELLKYSNQESEQEFSSDSDSDKPNVKSSFQNKIIPDMSVSMLEPNVKGFDDLYNISQSFNEKMLQEKNILDGGSNRKYPSQDDIDRISKVTIDSPMNYNNETGSLNRKTIESLREIERNRKLHLEQQGCQVIETERLRVQALKQRVQQEVRVKWAQRSQDCSSMHSTGSDDTQYSISCGNETDPEKTNINGKPTNQNELEPLRARTEGIDSPRPLSETSDVSVEVGTLNKKRNRPAGDKHRPLTRYLPIRSSDLDLKEHIESAGHQVVLCPHVTINSSTCRGFLHKRGSKLNGWSRRWFVFDRNKRTWVYYSDKSEKKARGGAYFQAIEEVYLDHSNSVKSPNPHLTFIVKTHERSFHLMAPSPEAMRIWIDVIFTGAEGYQEFEHGT